MTDLARTIVQNPKPRPLVELLLVVPLGTGTVRRGMLYYLGVFAPSVIPGIAVGLWSWRWSCYALAIGVALTVLIQSLVYLFWR